MGIGQNAKSPVFGSHPERTRPGGLRFRENLEIGAVKVQGKVLLIIRHSIAETLHLIISDGCDVTTAQASRTKVGETKLSQS